MVNVGCADGSSFLPCAANDDPPELRQQQARADGWQRGEVNTKVCGGWEVNPPEFWISGATFLLQCPNINPPDLEVVGAVQTIRHSG